MLALKNLLQQHNIKQAQLARDIKVSPGLMADLLNHEKWPTRPSKPNLIGMISSALAARDIAVTAALFEPATESEPVTFVTPNQEGMDMLLRKTALSKKAREHFKMFRDPFNNDIDEASDVFTSPDIRRVREYLWATAMHGGLVAVIGESGSGKSTLRYDLHDRIAREDAPIIVIEPYVLGMAENDLQGKTLKASAIIDSIISTLAPHESPRRSMETKSRQMHRILRDSHRAGFKHCLIIEEAHALSTATLKHLKRFFELKDGFKNLLSIILIGQTELKIKLSERSPEVREVVQRCEVVELPPLDAQLESYLAFKFNRVGMAMDDVFEPTALDGVRSRLIFAKSGKNGGSVSLMYPLMINNLITAALNQAAQLGFPKISHDLILEA
jgi:type II secretory pathway predicted ATPase ExeA